MYIYPDNLKASPTLFLWRLKDLAIIGIGALISVFMLSQTEFSLPVIATCLFGHEGTYIRLLHDAEGLLNKFHGY